MKVTLILIAVLASCSLGFSVTHVCKADLFQEQHREFELKINSTINSAFEKLAEFDPTNATNTAIDVLGVEVTLEKVFSWGFSRFHPTHIKVTGSKIWTLLVELQAPSLNYVVVMVNGWKADNPWFFGNGNLNLQILGGKLRIVAEVNPVTQVIRKIAVTPSCAAAEFNVTGLYNNETISQNFTDFVNNTLQALVNNKYESEGLVNEILISIIQNYLNKYKL